MSQKASQADSFLVANAPFRSMGRIARLSSLGFVQGLVDLDTLVLGRIGECRLAIACD